MSLEDVVLPPKYTPKLKEEYMNPTMLKYFQKKLLDWKAQLIAESEETLDQLRETGLQRPDITDRASEEADHALELRAKDRYRKLMKKLDMALQRIEEGEYGYCEVTGDPIGIERLEARPVASMTLEAQEQHEREEKLKSKEAV